MDSSSNHSTPPPLTPPPLTPPPLTPPPLTPPPLTPPPLTPPPLTPPPLTPPPFSGVISTIPFKSIITTGILVSLIGAATIAHFLDKPKRIEYAKDSPAQHKSLEATPTPPPPAQTESSSSLSPSHKSEKNFNKTFASPTPDTSLDSLSKLGDANYASQLLIEERDRLHEKIQLNEEKIQNFRLRENIISEEDIKKAPQDQLLIINGKLAQIQQRIKQIDSELKANNMGKNEYTFLKKSRIYYETKEIEIMHAREEAEHALLEATAKVIEYNFLNREIETDQALYNSVLEKIKYLNENDSKTK